MQLLRQLLCWLDSLESCSTAITTAKKGNVFACWKAWYTTQLQFTMQEKLQTNKKQLALNLSHAAAKTVVVLVEHF
jgi:hypothetical protein